MRLRTAWVLGLIVAASAQVTSGCGRDTSELRKGGKTSANRGGSTAAGGSEDGGASDGGSSNQGGTASVGAGGSVGSAGSTGAVAGSASGGVNAGGASNSTSGGVTGSAGSASGGVVTGGSNGLAGSSSSIAGSAGALPSPIAEVLDIGPTYSSQPTEMSLTTIGNQQFVAYWGGDSYLTVVSRTLGEKTWKKIVLSPAIQHDGHHSIVLAADKQGYLHLSGRMHNEPLTYLKSSSPMDIGSFKLQMSMVGTEESSCTYPRFFVGPVGDLIFSYRYGSSGQGDTIFNVYDATTKTWTRMLGSATSKFIDGQGANSAYIVGPTKGPDGYWHMVWTWRVNANAETNHDLSYVRSKDFLNWEKGNGSPQTIPITLTNADIVDPVPVDGGMINNNTKVGFDSQNRPVIIYHKFDAGGSTQLYNARVEGNAWVAHQSTNWTYRWYFSGMNTIAFKIEVDGVKSYSDGTLRQLYYHSEYGGWGGLLLNEATLVANQVTAPPFPYPAELEKVESTTAGMRARWGADAGAGPDPDIYYMIRWETLEPNGDQVRNPEPPPTTLRLYGFRKSVMTKLLQ